MQRINRTAVSPLPPDRVFARLADALSWPRWSPIGAAEIERPGPGEGEIRRFTTGRVVNREEVVVFEPPHRFAYRLLSGLPLRGYVAEVVIAPTGDGSRIEWTSTFQGRWPGSGPLYRLVLGRFIGRVVDGLAHARVDAADGTHAGRPSRESTSEG
jgi:uncharacterized protein YndB with AHSA1/START domain